MKYILVTGDKHSRVGKGVIACNIGRILKNSGYEVTAIKIDPYINIDAGTVSPYEHGEVFVLDDGSEVDLDLGKYERILDIALHEDNKITSGKIYQEVIKRERKGEFLGKTVQVVSHVTNCVQEWVERVALQPVSNNGKPEICIIELGGTIRDSEGMTFGRAFKQLRFRAQKENFCCVHVTLVPEPKATGEQETIQDSIRELKDIGISPDFVICLPDVNSVYKVSTLMKDQEVLKDFRDRLQLPVKQVASSHELRHIKELKSFPRKIEQPVKEIRMVLVEKYTGLEDSYASVIKALQHSNVHCNLKLNLKDYEATPMKYILVTGGVISGIGKGVIASSIGKLLKSNGYEVTAIKIDPYINIDAGTFSPYEHGEVFVLDDGSEVDLDLGNYERFIDITLRKDNNITTGKIFQELINREKKGEFLGKTLPVVPLFTDCVQEWVQRVALQPVSNDRVPEICIIELGGTIGDIESMSYVEAFKQFQLRVKKENFCCVHVSLVPQIKEPKSKPTQASVGELERLGLSPDLIVCRSKNPIDSSSVKQKISNFCEVDTEQVIYLPDISPLYQVPIFMEDQGLLKVFRDRLQLPVKQLSSSPELKRHIKEWKAWKSFARKIEDLTNEVRIALVGKYTGQEDSYASVMKALQHSSVHCNLKLNLEFIASADLEPETEKNDALRYQAAWENLCKTDGVLVPGGFGTSGVEGKIAAIEWARKSKKPFLGICLGFQLAVVEFARNVLGWKDAHSFEMSQGKSKKNVVIEMLEHHTGIMGGTMRLGKKSTMLKSRNSIIWQLYGEKDFVIERHRHRYEVDQNFVPELEREGLKFVGQDETGERLEILELEDHPFFIGVQFHPEYISRPLKPSPLYLGLILAASNKLARTTS